MKHSVRGFGQSRSLLDTVESQGCDITAKTAEPSQEMHRRRLAPIRWVAEISC